MSEGVPVCRIHEIEMVPVSWDVSRGRTTGTDYACEECIKEKEPGDPIAFHGGPIIEFYRFGANGEKEAEA